MNTDEFKKLSKEDQKKVPFSEKPKSLRIALIVVPLLLVGLMATCVGTCVGSGGSKSDGIDTLSLELHAKSVGQTAVKALLKAPASAQFPTDEQHYWVDADSTVIIKGAVDAQNAFGAMLRNDFYVKLKWHGDYEDTDNWSVIEATLE